MSLEAKCMHMCKEYSIVEAVELLQVWCLRRVQLLERRCFLMSSTHLDEFCECVGS